MKWKEHTVCRACGSTDLVPVLDMGNQPLANAFVRDGTPAPTAPLKVLHCPMCSLAQLSVVVDPSVLYHPSYAYVQQARTASFKAHVTALMKDIQAECKGKSVLEIGSNDGSFLAELRRAGFNRRMGIDPSATGMEPAMREPFNLETATRLYSCCGYFDLVAGRHVFAHLDDWKGFIEALDSVVAADGLVVLEVPDAVSLLEGNHWPSVYHEHLSYVCSGAVAALLRNGPFRLHDVRHYPIHGGSLGIFLKRKETMGECDYYHTAVEDWHEFSARTVKCISALRYLVQSLRSEKAIIAAYGAPAKATVIAAACGFINADLSFITDTTPSKVGCFLPGTNIPVLAPDALLEYQPDYTLLFCYTYQDEIIAQESVYRERGGKFIIPVPEPHIV